MRKADFKARVKKIEIANRTLTDGWAQAIRLILDDIELTDENLLELKQFKPNEPVMVLITPVQVTLAECIQAETIDDTQNKADDGGLFQLIESEPEYVPPEMIAKEWDF
ncbi:hypothetical protein [Desulforamulus aquiferis]|uniref:Uncharacterized protein n=1 Tax=Desulforamulus aquiferis TaxID=1397668 RepID=A0AAW7ZGE8_9FIRM|nr:hypothetical protein [Desulforamulus aquiferis]MDO7787890.1 hypothetical protein [Desulforamulus aquiferis]